MSSSGKPSAPKLPLKLGAAKSTLQADNSACTKFNEFQVGRGDPKFEDLQLIHVNDTFIVQLLNAFAEYLLEGDLKLGTMKGYIGKVKDMIVAKFPKLEKCKNLDWYKELLADLETASTRKDMLDDDKIDNKCLPFYMEISDSLVRQTHRKEIIHGDTRYAKDGVGLCALLLQQCIGREQVDFGPAQKRVWYVLCALAVGRGGEVKLQRYDEWSWDCFFHNIDATWSETKVLQKNPMLFGPTKYSEFGYVCDFYHAFGTFFVVEDGLVRGAKTASFPNFVFPQLHDVSSCAAKITEMMRELVHPNLKSRYSSRSIRKGQTTFLTTTSVSDFELETRGGWQSSIRSNSQSYKECTVGHTMPALNAMTGWLDIRSRKFPPRLECLQYAASKLDALEDHLYTIQVDAFRRPDGHLYPMLRSCTATLLMYHEKVLLHYGPSNLLVRKMIYAAEKAGIMDEGCHTPAATLLKWGEIIRVDFENQNIDCPDFDRAHIRELLKHYNDVCNNVTKDHQTIKANMASHNGMLHHVMGAVDAIQRFVTTQLNPFQWRSTHRASTSSIPNNIATPSTSATTSPTNCLPLPDVPPNVDGEITPMATTTVMEQPPMVVINDAVATFETNATLKRNNENNDDLFSKKVKVSALGDESACAKGIPLSELIVMIYNPHGSCSDSFPSGFNGPKENISNQMLPAKGEMDKQRACLQLVEEVITKEQWEKLCTSGLSNTEVRGIAEAIETECLARMLELEKQVGLATVGNNKKSKATGKFIGLGRRVVAFKKKLGLGTNAKVRIPAEPKINLKSYYKSTQKTSKKRK